MKSVLSLIISTALVGCSMNQTSPLPVSPTSAIEADRNEDYRPQIHFSPNEKWMNDPNGMFYLDGEYHLFFQHNPDASVWGPMHWGHAVSKDLVHWEERPIALYPDEQGTIFSGSAVVDWNNSSGLGSDNNPPIVALYTYHNAEMEKQGRIDYQTQALAYSLDKGQTWQKYTGNPVIENPGIKDFRDPKVMWHEPTQKWVMALAQKDHIGFYSSDNLIDWSLESTFGEEIGSHGGVWECPALLLMPVEGTNESRYVLLVSISPGGPNGGSATPYFVGDFDSYNMIFHRMKSSEIVDTNIVYLRVDYPLFVSDRDYIVKYYFFKEGNDVIYQWKAVEHQNVPVYDDAVRLINAAGEWRLNYISLDSTEVSYSWNGELLGDFPSFYLQKAWITGGKEIIQELRQAIENKNK